MTSHFCLLHQGKETREYPLITLLDTGATNSNYVSKSVARVIESNGQARQHSYTTILSGFNYAVRKSNGEITVQILLDDEMLNTYLLTLRAHIIATDIDLIIGRPELRRPQNLVKRFPSRFTIVDNERRVLKRGGLSC